MSAAGGLRRCARLSRLVSFSASHRLHRWGVITCVTASAGLFPLSLRPGAWPHAWVRADLGWAEEEMVKVWGCIAGPHPGGGGRALIPEAPLARFRLWAAPSSESCSSLASHSTQNNDLPGATQGSTPSFFFFFLSEWHAWLLNPRYPRPHLRDGFDGSFITDSLNLGFLVCGMRTVISNSIHPLPAGQGFVPCWKVRIWQRKSHTCRRPVCGV